MPLALSPTMCLINSELNQKTTINRSTAVSLLATCQMSVALVEGATTAVNPSKCPRAAVCFSKSNSYIEIPGRCSYSDEEARSIWYQPQEYKDIRMRNEAVVRQVGYIEEVYADEADSGGSCDSSIASGCQKESGRKRNDGDNVFKEEELYSRGLEHKFPGQGSRLINIRNAATRAVLVEQSQQKHRGKSDAVFLAELCREYTRPLQVLAQEVGNRDADEARSIHNNFDSEKASRKQLSVRFARRQVIKFIPHCSEFRADEKMALWFQKDELATMKRERKLIIRAIMPRKFTESDHNTSRGLEGLAGQGNKIRKRNKHMALHAVMDEQDRQDQEAYCSQEQIAGVYRSCSLHCAVAARKRGVEDEMCVRMYDLKERVDASKAQQSMSLSKKKISSAFDDVLLSPITRAAKNAERVQVVQELCNMSLASQIQKTNVKNWGDHMSARVA